MAFLNLQCYTKKGQNLNENLHVAWLTIGTNLNGPYYNNLYIVNY